MVWVSLSTEKNDFLTTLPPKVPNSFSAIAEPATVAIGATVDARKSSLSRIQKEVNSVLKTRSSSLEAYSPNMAKLKTVKVSSQAEDILKFKPSDDFFNSDSDTQFNLPRTQSLTIRQTLKEENKTDINIQPVSEENSLTISVELNLDLSNDEITTSPTQDPFPKVKKQKELNLDELESADWTSIDGQQKEGLTKLMSACSQELEHDVKDILRRKPNMIFLKDRTGKNAIHYCADNQNTTCISQLVVVHPEMVNIKDNDGLTVLQLCVISGNLTIIKFLLANKADLQTTDNDKRSVVHWSVVCGQIEVLETLWKIGADPSAPDRHGAHPIHYAAQAFSSSSKKESSSLGLVCLRKLLSFGVNPNVIDIDGRQPLLWAASAGNTDSILALVNHGADITGCDKDGLTALHCAASRGHHDCLNNLITLCGADLNKADKNGCTPLFYAVTLGHKNCTSTLLELGAHKNVKDRKGRTPAHGGAAKGQLETILLLSKYKANLWIPNNKGNLPFHEAITSGRQDLVKYFIQSNEKAVNMESGSGKKPLHLAAAFNNPELSRILILNKAEVNSLWRSPGRTILTPLDIATKKGHKAVVKYLQFEGGLLGSNIIALDNALQEKKNIERRTSLKSQNNGHEQEPKALNNPDPLPGKIKNIERRTSINNQNREQAQCVASNSQYLTEDIRENSSSKSLSMTQRSPAHNKLGHLASPIMSKSACSKFSSYGMDKNNLGILSTSDSETDDEDNSPRQSVKHRQRRSRRKRFSSYPHLNRQEYFSGVLSSSVSVGELVAKFSGAEESKPYSAFPDIIPCFPDAKPIQQQSQPQPQLQLQVVHQERELQSGYPKAAENTEEKDENPDFRITSRPSEKGYTSGESFIYEGIVKIKPKTRGEMPSRIRSDPKTLFYEQKKLRKHQIDMALQHQLYNLQSLKLRSSYTSEGVFVKRFTQDFNRHMTRFVGTQTYTGNFTFKGLEDHIVKQLKQENGKTSIITRTQSEGYITPDRNRRPALSSTRETPANRRKGISLPKLNSTDKRTVEKVPLTLNLTTGAQTHQVTLPTHLLDPSKSYSVSFNFLPVYRKK